MTFLLLPKTDKIPQNYRSVALDLNSKFLVPYLLYIDNKMPSSMDSIELPLDIKKILIFSRFSNYFYVSWFEEIAFQYTSLISFKLINDVLSFKEDYSKKIEKITTKLKYFHHIQIILLLFFPELSNEPSVFGYYSCDPFHNLELWESTKKIIDQNPSLSDALTEVNQLTDVNLIQVQTQLKHYFAIKEKKGVYNNNVDIVKLLFGEFMQKDYISSQSQINWLEESFDEIRFESFIYNKILEYLPFQSEYYFGSMDPFIIRNPEFDDTRDGFRLKVPRAFFRNEFLFFNREYILVFYQDKFKHCEKSQIVKILRHMSIMDYGEKNIPIINLTKRIQKEEIEELKKCYSVSFFKEFDFYMNNKYDQECFDDLIEEIKEKEVSYDSSF